MLSNMNKGGLDHFPQFVASKLIQFGFYSRIEIFKLDHVTQNLSRIADHSLDRRYYGLLILVLIGFGF